jgi:Fe-S-cluster-containing hydrogenase component 2
MTHKEDGVLRPDELNGVMPSAARLSAGPVVIVECVEHIPCNPCVDACPKGAITIEGDINSVPSVDYDKCNGCGLCISACPGLAIFVVDASREDDRATVMVPYEFRPLPVPDEEVVALDRTGRKVCVGRVVRVVSTNALDRTPIVEIDVPKDAIADVRHFRPKDS